jgi:hypothetical protein
MAGVWRQEAGNFSLHVGIHAGFPIQQMTFYVIRLIRGQVALFHDHRRKINLLKLAS